jgi:hypothetical protein
MQLVSTKTGRFHPLAGLRKVEVHFGEPIPPETYLSMPREEFLEFVRRSITLAAKSAASVPVAGRVPASSPARQAGEF